MNLNAIRLDPSCASMHAPALATRSFVSRADVGCEQILD